jgi:hypothetical protein
MKVYNVLGAMHDFICFVIIKFRFEISWPKCNRLVANMYGLCEWCRLLSVVGL